MRIPVILKKTARNGYRAKGLEPFAVSAKGATREEALAKLRVKIEERLKKGEEELVEIEVGTPVHPWMEFAGMFKDDPWIDDWKQSVEEYRKKVNEDAELP